MSIRFVPAMLVALLIALVAAGGAALAVGQNSGGGGSEATDDLLERAAVTLGLDPQTVKDALAQAQTELSDERQEKLIAALVEKGVITQEQADEVTTWLDARPAAVDRLMVGGPGAFFGFAPISAPVIMLDDAHLFRGAPLSDEVAERMAGILGIDPDAFRDAVAGARVGQAEDHRKAVIDEVIAGLVEAGDLTAAEGEEIKAWLDEMPGWLGDHELMFKLLGGEFGGGLALRGLDIKPFFREFDAEIFPFPKDFDGPRRDPGRFTIPDDVFRFPRFDFDDLEGDGSENRFYYKGPEGEFEFDGEIPPKFRDLLERLEGRFGDHHGEFPFDLDELLEGRPFFRIPPLPDPPAPPEGSDVSAESIQGARQLEPVSDLSV